jgi:conjugal transfer pilus assembly protein TraW
MKTSLLAFFIVNFMTTSSVSAQPRLLKDHGIVGTTFEIQEEDLLEVIERKLQVLEKDGSLQVHQKKMVEEAQQKIKRPKPVEGVRHTTEGRSFIYDPSLTVSYDLKDHQGKVFYKAGTKVNPLDYRYLSKPLLFIDGDDEQQVEWVLKQGEEGTTLIILIKGSPFELMAKLDRPIYFDQEGTLTSKLKITQVPARVTQQGQHLLIEELLLQKKGRS